MGRYDPAINHLFNVMASSANERLCRCIFHNDLGKPNLYANADTGLYYCHSCGAKGSIDNLINSEEIPEITAQDLRSKLKQAGKVHVVNKYPESWLDQFDYECDYWTKQRCFSPGIIKKFRLGYDPITDRATIPIRDSRKNVLGVIYRALDNSKPKYTNPKGFQKAKDLYGSFLVKGKRDRIALVEGPLDAVACWDARVPAMAMHGSRLSNDQANLIRALGVKTVVCMTDNDKAGIEATLSIKEALKETQVYIAWYRSNWSAKDPGELSKANRRHMFLSSEHWSHFL